MRQASKEHAQKTGKKREESTAAHPQDTMQVSGEPAPTATHEDEHSEPTFSPIGTIWFVMLMITGYIIYWFYMWYIVVIERG